MSMDTLCKRLEQVLRPTLSLSEAINGLMERRYQSSETPQDLLRFAYVACPTLAQADKEKVVLHHFLEGLRLPDLKHTFIMHPPIELHGSIARIERYRQANKAHNLTTTPSPRPGNQGRTAVATVDVQARYKNDDGPRKRQCMISNIPHKPSTKPIYTATQPQFVKQVRMQLGYATTRQR
ncbi:hypothetical protein AAHC03_05761 [Spirometra sp. Aus1]